MKKNKIIISLLIMCTLMISFVPYAYAATSLPYNANGFENSEFVLNSSVVGIDGFNIRVRTDVPSGPKIGSITGVIVAPPNTADFTNEGNKILSIKLDNLTGSNKTQFGIDLPKNIQGTLVWKFRMLSDFSIGDNMLIATASPNYIYSDRLFNWGLPPIQQNKWYNYKITICLNDQRAYVAEITDDSGNIVGTREEAIFQTYGSGSSFKDYADKDCPLPQTVNLAFDISQGMTGTTPINGNIYFSDFSVELGSPIVTTVRRGTTKASAAIADVQAAMVDRLIMYSHSPSGFVNGQVKRIDQSSEAIAPFINSNNIYMIPAQFTLTNLGYTMNVNPNKTDEITIENATTKLQMQLNSKYAVFNGVLIQISDPPIQDNGIIYIPANVLTKYLDQKAFIDGGLIIVSKNAVEFTSSTKDQLVLQDIVKQCEAKINHSPYPKDPKQEYYFQGYFLDTTKNVATTGAIKGVDDDGDILSYSLLVQPKSGTATVANDGKVTYVPNSNFIGIDKFIANVNDGRGGVSQATVRINVVPSVDEIISTINQKFPSKAHPRLMWDNQDFATMKTNMETDTFLKKTINNVIAKADDAVKLTTVPTIVDRGAIQSRLCELSVAYKITGYKKYFDRAWLELQKLCDPTYIPKWMYDNEPLDKGVIANGVAFAYDWLYNDLTVAQRKTIRDTIYTQVFVFANKELTKTGGGIDLGFNNYNGVMLSGCGLAALVLLDDDFDGNTTYSSTCKFVFDRCIKSIPRGLLSWAPDGGYYEAMGYGSWMYRMNLFFLSAMDKSLGFSYDKDFMADVYKAPTFVQYINGGLGEFNYCDGQPPTKAFVSPIVLYGAKKANKPEYAWFYYQLNEANGGDFSALVGYDKTIRESATKPTNNDVYFRNVELALLHSDLGNKNENYAGFIVGSNVEWHTGLEIGNFVIDALGVRWITSLGGDAYSLPGYAAKTNIYRKRSEGRNTLVINPSMEGGQVPSHGKIEKFVSNSNVGFAVADMTGAYIDEAFSAKRGISSFGSRKQFLLQDEIKARRPSEIWSFMHTTSSITMSVDNKSAMLTDTSGKRFWVQVLSPANAILVDMAAEPLLTSPNILGQNPNIGFRKLGVHIENTKDTTISVWMVPLLVGESVNMAPPVLKPLSAWSMLDASVDRSNKIIANGNKLIGIRIFNDTNMVKNNSNVYVATYQEGKMIDKILLKKNITLNIGENFIDFSEENITISNTIKSFVWDYIVTPVSETISEIYDSSISI